MTNQQDPVLLLGDLEGGAPLVWGESNGLLVTGDAAAAAAVSARLVEDAEAAGIDVFIIDVSRAPAGGRVATDVHTAAALLNAVHEVAETRPVLLVVHGYAELAELRALPPMPVAGALHVVGDAELARAAEAFTNDLRRELVAALGSILRHGRSTGVHLLLTASELHLTGTVHPTAVESTLQLVSVLALEPTSPVTARLLFGEEGSAPAGARYRAPGGRPVAVTRLRALGGPARG